MAGELFLQAASFVASRVAVREGGVEAAEDGITILCVGDSHTYGLPLPPEQSYPFQLEARLSERHPQQRFQVANLGIPGVNSGYVANRLERQMLQLRPRLVLVWVGINNRWNAAEVGGETGALGRLLLRSRLVRLARIAWITRTGHQYDPEQHGGWFEGEAPPSARRAPDAVEAAALAPGLARDVARMVDTARVLETPIVFLTYPMRKQRPLNRIIERAAFDAGVPVLDGVRDFERAVGDGHPIPDLIDLSAGPHPTALLYGYLVESLVPVVEDLLGLSSQPVGGAGRWPSARIGDGGPVGEPAETRFTGSAPASRVGAGTKCSPLAPGCSQRVRGVGEALRVRIDQVEALVPEVGRLEVDA